MLRERESQDKKRKVDWTNSPCQRGQDEWSKILDFPLPLLSLVISEVVLQKRFITCSRDLVVLYISLLPPTALFHISP